MYGGSRVCRGERHGVAVEPTADQDYRNPGGGHAWARRVLKQWAEADLNRRHTDFQSVALPTELPARAFERSGGRLPIAMRRTKVRIVRGPVRSSRWPTCRERVRGVCKCRLAARHPNSGGVRRSARRISASGMLRHGVIELRRRRRPQGWSQSSRNGLPMTRCNAVLHGPDIRAAAPSLRGRGPERRR